MHKEILKVGKINGDLRGCVDHILKNWEGIKEAMGNDFNIAMSQTSEAIKHQDITIKHANRSISNQSSP